MLPAHQCLAANDVAVGHVDLRLVVQHDLAAQVGIAQLALQLQPLGGGGVHVRGVELESVATARLGLVHSDVGIADQVIGFFAVARIQADADGGRGREFASVNAHRYRHGGQDAGCDFGGGALVGTGQHQQEFVAAQPRQDVVRAGKVRQAAGHFAQHHVADGVAQRVVDGLELVQVDKQYRQRMLVLVHAGDGLAQPAVQRMAVGQSGQGVEMGVALDLLFVFLLVGHVVDGTDKARSGRVFGGSNVLPACMHPAHPAAGRADPEAGFQPVGCMRLLLPVLEGLTDAGLVVRVHPGQPQGGRDRLLLRYADVEALADGASDGDGAGRQFQFVESGAGGLQCQPQACVAVGKGGSGLLELADVAGDQAQQSVAFGVGQHAGGDFDGQGLAVAATERGFQRDVVPARNALLQAHPGRAAQAGGDP